MSTIETITEDRMILEGEITKLISDFMHKHQKVKVSGVEINMHEARDTENKIITTCISVDVKLSI